MNGTIECAFIGRLGQDPDLRTAASGKLWMRLSLAVGRANTTQWVTVAVFDDLAKGSQLQKLRRATVCISRAA